MERDLERALSDSRSAADAWMALTSGLTAAQANWQPSAERWSIAQCMEHLNVTAGKLLPALRDAVATARERGITADGPFAYGFVGKWFLRSQSPEVTRPLSTPGTYRPSSSALDAAAVLRRYRELQEAFESVVTTASGLDLARVRVASPAFPLLRLQLGIWLLSTASHALRHLHQAERVRSDERFPR